MTSTPDMDTIQVISGALHRDARGQLACVNGFNFPNVKRFYTLHHPDPSVVRGWNGHRFERKWFYCVKGSFALGLTRIDNWESPSGDLPAELFRLTAARSEVIAVPGGYANAIKALEPDSIILVFSDKTVEESTADSYRFSPTLWIDWSQLT